jgi:phosphatidate cytidylyltransferase
MVTIIVIMSVLGRHWMQLLITILMWMMLCEWVTMNTKSASSTGLTEPPRGTNSHPLLPLTGIAYIAIPMLYWLHVAGHHKSNFMHDVMWCVAVVSACDVAAYFGGRLFGGPKLAPNISKNKTWSGAISGFAIGFAISYVFASRFVYLKANVLLCSILMPLAAILGDLLESKAKRLLDVKDSGSIIPGHGGVCDRLDSFLLTSYVVILLRLFGY